MSELTISVNEFKAKCLAIFDDLEAGTVERVVITRRGNPVGELLPQPSKSAGSLWGAARGSVTVAPGVDLTDPVLGEPLDAEQGILHR
jgi:antitoxin (DNA-binding transcriptional repressor) of toxin-antitoxin stability system